MLMHWQIRLRTFEKTFAVLAAAVLLTLPMPAVAQDVDDSTAPTAAPHGAAQAARPERFPLPPSKAVPSKIASVDVAIPKRWISIKIPIPQELQGLLESREDLKSVEKEAMRALIDDKSVPNSKKRIRATRYTVGDPEIMKLLIEAKKKGIAVDLTFDPNPVMEADFKDGEAHTADFRRMRVKARSGEEEDFISGLLKAGFVLGQDLIPEPLYNTKVVERTPIMHEKGLILIAGDKKSMLLSSENWPRHMRVNEMKLIVDPDLVDEYDAHVQTLIDAYRAGKETKDIPDFERIEHVYQDGSSIEFAFTNGRFNPNDRAVETASEKDNEMVLYSHFAFTNRRLSGAIINSMKDNPNLELFGASDDKFSTAYGFGMPLTFNGITVNPPLGPAVRGAPAAIARRAKTFVFRQRAIDPDTGKVIESTEEDGIPVDRVLLHTKVTAFFKKIWTIIYEGSFNASSNVANAEFQMKTKVKRDSWHARATEHWIRTMVQTYPKLFVRGEIAAVASEIAHIIKVSDLDLNPDDVNAVVKALLEKRYDDAKKIILQFADTTSKVNGTLSREKRVEKLTLYNSFLDFYVKELPPWTDPRLSLDRMIGVASLLAHEQLSTGKRRELLEQLTWRPEQTPEQQEVWVQKGADLLGLGKLPASQPRQPHQPRQPRQGHDSGQGADHAGAGTEAKTSADETTAPAHKRPTTGVRTHTHVAIAAAAKAAATIAEPPTATVAASTHAAAVSPTTATGIEAPPAPDLRYLHGVAATDITIWDWDNTVMNLPTKIRLFENVEGSTKFIDVSSADYAKLGPTGYPNYVVRKTATQDSFIHFTDASFQPDIRAALAQPNHGFAPAMFSWLERLKDPKTAQRTLWATARSHQKAEFMAGMAIIKEFVKHTYGLDITIPPIENLIEVGYASDVPKEKAARILARLPEFAQLGGVKRVFFFDDDAKNVLAVNNTMRDPANRAKLMGLHVHSVQVLPSGPVYRLPVAARKSAPSAVAVRQCLDLFSQAAGH